MRIGSGFDGPEKCRRTHFTEMKYDLNKQ